MNLTGNVLSVAGVLEPILSDDIFDKRDELEYHELEQLLVTKEFEPGESVFEQGSTPACLWIIDSGIAILSQCVRNELLFTRTVRAGHAVGLTESLARIPFAATLRTASPCVCQRLDHGNLVELLRKRPRLRLRLLETLALSYIDALAGFGTIVTCDLYHIPRTTAGIEWVTESKSHRNRHN